MHTGGATGTWRQLRGRRRGEVRQPRRGDKGGRAAQQWWRLMRSYIHQQRCRRQQNEVVAEVEVEKGELRPEVVVDCELRGGDAIVV